MPLLRQKPHFTQETREASWASLWRIPLVRASLLRSADDPPHTDTVKVRIQTKPVHYTGMLNCFVRMVREEGVSLPSITTHTHTSGDDDEPRGLC